MKNTLPCPLRAITVARDDDSSRIATLKKASGEDGRATSQLSLALGQRVRGDPSPPKSYTKATDRRIFISLSTMAKSLGALSKSFEITDK